MNLPHSTTQLCYAQHTNDQATSPRILGNGRFAIAEDALAEAGLSIPVATVIAQVDDDQHDPAFQHPTKPAGLFYSAQEAQLLREGGQEVIITSPDRLLDAVLGKAGTHIVPDA